ncbi:MAG: Na+/H+ antiporter subunit E, partial [Alphaproteobacteria bacterium]
CLGSTSKSIKGIKVRVIGAIITFLGLWLLLSGVYKPLTVGLGVLSTLFVIFIINRMDSIDGDRVEIHLKPLEFLKYQGWLLVEIAKANWIVTKIILSPSLPIKQHLFSVPCTQKSDLGQVIFANSITLTPGTVSVETEQGHFLVHAVAYSTDDKAAIADMDRRVTACEKAYPE